MKYPGNPFFRARMTSGLCVTSRKNFPDFGVAKNVVVQKRRKQRAIAVVVAPKLPGAAPRIVKITYSF